MKNLKIIKFSQILSELEKYNIYINNKIDKDLHFNKLNTINSADVDDLTFFSNKKYLNDLKNNRAKACFIQSQFVSYLPKNCTPIIVEDPYLCLSIITNLFNDKKRVSNGVISKYSIINEKVNIHKNVQIDPFSLIESNTEIFDNVIIGSNSKIGPNVIIHNNVEIQDNVSISNTTIMHNCVIQSGSRIGGQGFGFEEKTKQKITHTGNVLISNNCNIGANTTIDRAVFQTTKIGQYSQIDNLVQIAHNVEIGDHAIIAAQVGIAGSTKIGDFVKIGGQAGISGHLEIGNNVTIAAKSGVTKNINNNKIVAGFPAKDIILWKKEIIKNTIRK